MAYQYTTPERIKAELRATADFSDTTIPTLDTVNDWIADASDEINQIAGRVYGETDYTETFDYNGEVTLITKNAPIVAINSLLYSTSDLGTTTYGLTATKVEDTDFTVYKGRGEIDILFGNWSPSCGKKRIQINYSAGFEDVPGPVKMLTTKKVTKRVLDSLMNKDVNEKKSGKSVSVGSISIVKPADFGVSQYKVLSGSISTLENDLVGGSSLYRLPLNRK